MRLLLAASYMIEPRTAPTMEGSRWGFRPGLRGGTALGTVFQRIQLRARLYILTYGTTAHMCKQERGATQVGMEFPPALPRGFPSALAGECKVREEGSKSRGVSR